jgi:hypothetical protein
MLEEIQALGLAGLVVAHYFLVRGCSSIRESIPDQGGNIAGKIDRTADLLDEMAQLIADFADGVQGQSPPPTQMQGGLGGLLSTWLMSNTALAGEHGTKEQEWTVHPPEHNETTKTQD